MPIQNVAETSLKYAIFAHMVNNPMTFIFNTLTLKPQNLLSAYKMHYWQKFGENELMYITDTVKTTSQMNGHPGTWVDEAMPNSD